MHYLLLFIAGLAAGVVSTLAGGGSFISLSALLFMGVPAVVANGTNRISILFQTGAGAVGFKSKKVSAFPYSLWLGLAAVPGSIIGAELAVRVSEATFDQLLAIFMLVYVVLMFFETVIKAKSSAVRIGKKYRLIGLATFFFLGIYGGFIKSGMGFLIILSIHFIHRFPIAKTNSIKVIAILILTLPTLIVFSLNSAVHWEYGIVLGAGAAIGGWFSSRWSVGVDDKIIRYIILAVILGLAVKIWFF